MIFFLKKFGDGGYRISYRATEMDLNSIFGELFKYVSKLLITLYIDTNVVKVIVFWQRGESCRGEHETWRKL